MCVQLCMVPDADHAICEPWDGPVGRQEAINDEQVLQYLIRCSAIFKIFMHQVAC